MDFLFSEGVKVKHKGDGRTGMVVEVYMKDKRPGYGVRLVDSGKVIFVDQEDLERDRD